MESILKPAPPAAASPSMSNEKGVDMLSMTSFVYGEARFTLTMAVVLVRAQEKFLAISESGNIVLKSLVAWSLDKKARLCLATNVEPQLL